MTVDGRIPAIIARLEENGAQAAAFFRALAPDQWSVPVYTDGHHWHVQQVLAHFVTIEQSMHWLFRNIAGGGAGTGEDFDLERFNRRQVAKLSDVSPECLLARFEAVRAETVVIVCELAPDDLDREGRHPVHGIDRLEVFVRWAYQHVDRHLQDIQRALSAGSPSAS